MKETNKIHYEGHDQTAKYCTCGSEQITNSKN